MQSASFSRVRLFRVTWDGEFGLYQHSQCTSIKGLMVSIRWYPGYPKQQLGGAGRGQIWELLVLGFWRWRKVEVRIGMSLTGGRSNQP